ncbi:NosD domain-containing protein [Halobacteriota archaeon]
MKNKIEKLCALFIIFAVGFSSLNGIAIAANNQVNPTGDSPDKMLNNTLPVFTAAIPTIASELSNTIITTDVSFASKTKSILQIENVKSNLTYAQKKLSTDLLQLVNSSFLPEGQNRENLEMQMKRLGQFRPASSVSLVSDGRVADDLVYVYIYLKPFGGTQTIEPYVWEITDRDEENHLAVAWVEVEDLETLASQESVRTIRTVMPPLVRIGSVTTEGDAIHRTADVRANHSQSGSGMRIGIISDGVDHLVDAQISGDLPAGLTVLSNTQGGDEGTAMLEIVHDMVPGADLYFHDCGANTVAFNAAIDDLVAAGCDVVCDDIGWITQPFFEDGTGTVASHLASVLASNDIIYVSSAGNAGNKHYQDDYYPISGSTQHDFSHGGTTPYLYLQMQAGGSVRIVLQWSDQFGFSGNDYDLGLYSFNTASYVAASVNMQDGNDNPLEFISYTVPGGTATGDYAIVVDKYSGVGKTLEVFIYSGPGCGVYTNNIDPVDSIFGHPAVPNAIAVGAIDANDPGNDDIEPFSSQGPVTISYPTPVSRPKPDICGIDGVAITGAGGFYVPFYGTSAAAPHIAAIAAQMWGAFPDKTANEIRTVLYSSTVDLGGAGYDSVFGYGRSDALEAFESIVPPTITAFNPSSPVSDVEGATREFNLTTDQTVTAIWLINGTIDQTNTSVTFASYTNTSAKLGVWNVSAITTNTNGTAMQTWIWDVTLSLLKLNIINAQTDKSAYDLNENVTISCIVQNETGANTTADNVTAEITKPDSSIEWIALSEGLTGNYNGTFTNTSLAGAYNVAIYANKTGYVNDTAELSFVIISGLRVITVNDDGGADYTSIQDAINNASDGDSIEVWNGTYNENVDVNKRLTIYSRGGADVTIVQALSSDDHVFNVTADYVNLSGFTVKGASSSGKSGIYLGIDVDHCNITDNKALDNGYGIYLSHSSNNTISNNNASNNDEGIYLWYSGNNIVSKNTAYNNWCGIELGHSSNNTVSSNIANSNNYYGIRIWSSGSNTVSNNTANSNSDCGIRLWYSGSNIISSNTANNNNVYGIYLWSSSNNNSIYNNYFNNMNNAYDDGNNIWNISKTLGTNIIGGPYLGGNYWSDYAGFDINGDGLGDNLLPYTSSGTIQNGGDYLPLVSVGVAPPTILSFFPPSPVSDIEGSTRTFNISINQSVNVSWQINGTEVQTNESLTEASYTNMSAVFGTWNISAVASNENGTDMKTWIWNVTDSDPTADFTGTPTSGPEPLTVNFTDASTSYDGIISWLWEFGDGTNSTEQNPTHDYAQEGVYTVSLTVTEADTDSDVETKLGHITVLNTDPIAEFSAIPKIGFKPLAVNFTDLSSSYDGIVSWFWEFGDGTNSTDQNPTHIYLQDGVYTVSLTVTEADSDSDTETKIGYIVVAEPEPPLIVNISTDKSEYVLGESVTITITAYYSNDIPLEQDGIKSAVLTVGKERVKPPELEFVDGVETYTFTPTKIPKKGGEYTAQIKITDILKNRVSAKTIFTVVE